MKRSGNFFLNVMTSGKPLASRDEAVMDIMVRYILLNSMIFLGCTLLLIFGMESLERDANVQAIFDFSMAFMTLVGFVVLRTKAPFIISGYLTVVPFMMLCLFLALNGGPQGSGVLWVYSFPLLSVFLLGMKRGVVLSVLLLAGVSAALFIPGVSPFVFHRSFALRTVGVYTLVLVCTIVYEQTKVTKDRWVARLNKIIQSERDEMEAMKDNLKTGLFLMNRDFIIQPQYSRAMETVLSQTDLSGKVFIDLLSSSLQSKEMETLRDYFTMIYNKSYDEQMLEDINPLHQFAYKSITGSSEKTLRCNFTSIDRDDGESYILGTIEDVTLEVELQQQLNEEELRRQDQMRALFEVIHVEPTVLNDFIFDTEYEFDRINELLKNKAHKSSLLIQEIYQSIHAIKSNALILGLESFATNVHKLEDEIKILREHADVSFQEILHVTVEIEKIMKMKDGFKDIIRRIMAFNTGEGRLREEQVLVQTLQRVVDKASDDIGKKASLVVRKMDPAAVVSGNRRIMKEVLMQLVRNAMYHGIEYPADRRENGKDETGSISLSIERDKGQIVIRLSDDGKGLDFNKIHQKAVEQKLVPPDTPVSDRNALLKVLFASGFSTAEKADMHAGRGVGLNLVRDRVRECHGSIKLQSDAGKGTSFLIYLPVQEEQGVQTA